jgi:DNA-binding protein H-NS
MIDLDLNALTLPDLEHLHKEVTKAVANLEDRKLAEAREAVEARAREFGFTLSDLVDDVSRKTRTRPRPKYRHPKDASVTWTGRGRKPMWFAAAIAKGIPPNAMLL